MPHRCVHTVESVQARKGSTPSRQPLNHYSDLPATAPWGSGLRVRRGKGSGLGGLVFSDEDVRKGGLCICAWLEAAAHLSCPLAPWHWSGDVVKLGLLCLPPPPFCSHLKDPEEQTPGPQPVLSPYRVSMKKAAPKARYPRLSVPLWSNVLPHSPVFPQLTLESSSAVLAPQPGFILGGPVGKPRP